MSAVDPELAAQLARIEAALSRIEAQGRVRKGKAGKRAATIMRRATAAPTYQATPLQIARTEQRLRRAGRL